MNTIVFVGPTLSVHDAQALLAADYRPPVAQGDVYRAALEKPWGIGIIDGYFERVPAVWHKEILWAMSRGIHVFGAASMGALRAVELEAFGMLGVGEIVGAFRRGELCADDEVSVLHAPAEHGYRAQSEALVDIRATLAAAEQRRVLSPQTAAALVALARRRHYSERSYAQLVRDAAASGLAGRELAAFEAFLPAGRISQKQRDARALLSHIARVQREQPGPKRTTFVFEHTDAFERAMQHAARPQLSATDRDVLEELRLEPAHYAALVGPALTCVLARPAQAQPAHAPAAAELRELAEEFRRARGLFETDAVLDWLERAGLDRDSLAGRLGDELRVRELRAGLRLELEAQLLIELRISGDHARLCQRASHKAELLARHAHEDPDPAATELGEHALWTFCYGAESDPKSLMRQLDYADPYVCLRALTREYLYRRLIDSPAPYPQHPTLLLERT